MKRIAGTFVLLAGLSGCISFTAPNPPDKKPSEAKAPSTPPGTNLAQATPSVPAPAPTNWTMNPGHLENESYQDHTVARPSLPCAQETPDLPPSPTPVVSAPPGGLQPALAAEEPAMLPGSLRQPAVSPAAANSGLPVMPGMPVVMTPRGEHAPIKQTSFNQEEVRQPLDGPNLEVRAPTAVKSSIALPPVPSVKGFLAGEIKFAKSGAPLMRLVNTKRITLNFEVKDVGPSGLSCVELWYTQDCREWKKYDAPTKAKCYVVEVDSEGMYGFTLLARSGIGLGKQPPSPGDQPQVWVIVDLTKPDVELTEVAPSVNYKVQQCSIKWKASDKNLSRQPVSLFYAAKEDGPWKCIAANLENNGAYDWQVPLDAPAQFLVRVEAIDLAGNVGRAQSATPVLLDTRVPTVSIVNVEANGTH